MFLALLFLTSVVAFSISTVSGGGAGLVLLPVLGMGLAAAQVPVALSVGSTISSVARLGIFLRDVDWRLVRRFVPLSLPGAFLGVWLLDHMNPLYLQAVLGVFLLGNLSALLRRRVEVAVKPARAGTVMTLGLIAGFVSGLTGAVGLLFNGFYLRSGLGKQHVIATRAANEVLLHVSKLVLYAAFGLFTTDALGAGAIVGTAAVAAAIGTRRLLPHLSEALFRRVGFAAMVVAGAVMTVTAASGLAAEHQIAFVSHPADKGFDVRLHGFGQWVTVELRTHEFPEIEYLLDFDQLPDERKRMAAPLVDGAERVVVEAVLSWRSIAFELHVHRDGVVVKYDI